MDLTLRTVETVLALKGAGMDALTAGKGIFAGYPHIAATEGDAGLQRNHLVARDAHGRLVGVLPTYLRVQWPDFDAYLTWLPRKRRKAGCSRSRWPQRDGTGSPPQCGRS